MIFHKHIPKSPLDNYVDCIVYVEGNNKGVGFPKTAMSLVLILTTVLNYLLTDNLPISLTIKNIGLQDFKPNQLTWKVMEKVK